MLFKVIFVMMLINRLDSRQNEDNRSDDVLATEPTSTPPQCHNQSSEISGSACKIGGNINLHFQWSNSSATGIKVQEDNGVNCYKFESHDSYFTARIEGVVENCFYVLLSSFGTHYFEGINNVQSACPNKEPICITKKIYTQLSECPIKNFTVVSVILKDQHKYINLNLSWEKMNSKAAIHIIKTDDSKADCWPDSHIFDHSLLNNSMLKPGMVTQVEVRPSCKYQISIVSESQKEQFKCMFYYTVPECVEDVCDCEEYGPRPSVSSVESIGENKFLVKWDPGKKAANGREYTTKLVNFKYKLTEYHSEYAEELSFNGPEGTSEIVMKLIDGENYTLIAEFGNNFSCEKMIKFSFIAPKNSNHNVLIILLVGIILFIFITAFNYKKVLRYKDKLLNLLIPSRRSMGSPELTRLRTISIPMKQNIQYTPVEILEGIADQYEFPKNQIKIKEVIGSGAFGQVYSAKAVGIGGIKGYKMVAVKTLGEGENITREATNDFIAEIEIFKKIGHHPNIVALLGCCTLEPPYMMIMEFVPCGDLKNYLLELREQWLKKKNVTAGRRIFFPENSDGDYVEGPKEPTTPTSVTSSRLPSTTETVWTFLEDPMTPRLSDYTHALDKVLDHTELQNFALQIAKGMAHLEKIAVTHRDLAARNILINEFKTLKISDFGLSRSGPYINHKTKKLPLRWMAIEAIVDQKYDNKSDVWSFGVVLWEIGTLGAFPYESVPDSFIQQFLQMGRRLERPEICTDELYDVMKQCWATEPEKRPMFQELTDLLDVKKQKVYVNFNQLNPTYVFPPSDMQKLKNAL